jgi:protease II
VIPEFIESIEVQEKFEENIMTEQIEVEEKVFAEVEEGIHFNADDPIPGHDEPYKFVSKFKEKSEPENLFRRASEFEAKEPLKAVVDKDVIEKVARDYIKTHLENQIESLSKTVKKNRILSFILFVISLLLILALYFIK